ncbi:MAG: hypothetical protein EBU04_06740 [Verrucomicrobia bacterium]|nr:hypothetical protein [Verrucomicrobiota bacterium]
MGGKIVALRSRCAVDCPGVVGSRGRRSGSAGSDARRHSGDFRTRPSHRTCADSFSLVYLQSLSSENLAVDIHPAARFGVGILLDHATGFVAGETTVVDDNVSFLHEVTLGGTGKARGDRHPKIRSGVLVGAGAKILGNITIGEGAKIGAGSVVLKDVAAHTSVAGVPAVMIGRTNVDAPALDMDHSL